MNDTEDYRPSRAAQEPDAEENPRLMEAVREYQTALESGSRPSRSEFLDRHTDIAQELADCLDGLEFLHVAAPRLQSEDGVLPAPVPVQPDGTLGDFRLVREIGRGGMGVVYEAVQISLGRRVALKVLPFAATLDARQLQRFENEARAAAQLHHTNIVPVFAVGNDRGVHYYAMQLIEGRTLATVIEHLRKSPPQRPALADTGGKASVTEQSVGSKTFFRTAAQIGVQAAEALEYAHQMGVVHRDVKPANLLLDRGGNVWVTDFGLARFQSSPTMTAPGDVLGTLRYMSPEQAAGKPIIDPRSDVYSLGITLYELVTQRPAFAGVDRQECLRQVLNEEPVPPRRLANALPAELETIILKAIAKQPEDRYGSAKDMADDLRCFLDDKPVRAQRPSLRERAAKWTRRHRRVVTAAFVGLVAAVLILAATTWRVSRAEADAQTALQQLKKEQERTNAEKARAELALQKEAEERIEAREMLDFVIRKCVDEMADKPMFQKIRQQLLTKALDYYSRLIERNDNPAITNELLETKAHVVELLADTDKVLEAFAAYDDLMRDRQRMGGGTRSNSFFGPSRGFFRLLLLGQRSVQEDLKLTADQKKTLNPLLELRRDRSGDDSFAAKEKKILETLTPEQDQRLQQIHRQLRGPTSLLEAADSLELSDEQKAAIRAIRDKPMHDIWHHEGGSGRHRPEIDWKQYNEQALEVLTPEQQSRWKEMLGTPFGGAIRFGPPRGRGAGG